MKKTSIGCLGLFLVVALGVSLLLNFVLFTSNSGVKTAALSSSKGYFEKMPLQGSGSDQVAVVSLYGVISYGMSGEVFASMVEDVVAKLKQAREDQKVKAVILRVDSPGGEVTASDVIYRELTETRKVKPVVVFMESVAASGGYYVAVGGSHLMANELTITGSIGVILQTFQLGEMSKKIGLDVVTVKSGKMKDILNPFRPVQPEELALIQEMIDETYNKFLGVVAEERKKDAEEMRNGLADGRILSGKRALEAGLIDSTGYFDDAVEMAMELGGVEQASVVEIQAPYNFGRLLRLFGSSIQNRGEMRVRLGPESLELEAGRLYFISPHVLTR
ncbi:MAG: signal peptide peptidase SppA [Candidatus Methylacidiphilales bacterium]